MASDRSGLCDAAAFLYQLGEAVVPIAHDSSFVLFIVEAFRKRAALELAGIFITPCRSRTKAGSIAPLLLGAP